jgi:aspartyl/asparaginyl beta-hydroxylase (cupin superfamily)
LPAPVRQLVEQAMQSERSGRAEEANGLWHKVLDIEPRHTQALRNLGIQALQRRDLREALMMLEAARLTAPTDLFVLLALADARESAGDADGELEAIRWALAVDPLYVPALLKKGRWYERQGKARSACDAYSEALKSAGPEAQWPGQLRNELDAGRNYISRHARDLHQLLSAEIADYVRQVDSASVERWREAASLHAGRSAPYTSASESLHIPRLQALPFFESSGFPFLAGLEAGVALIRDELAVVLERGEFRPCVAYRPDEPVNQWQELNHSSRWSAYHLWRNGEPVEENLESCPATTRLLEEVELCDLGGLGPNVFFSALAPKTHIPPHHGATNARVIAHLPLIAPEDCRLRVGFEERHWREGETLVFDDTIENEAFNDSDALRVVMSFELWNPLLGDADRQVAMILAEARSNFGS